MPLTHNERRLARAARRLDEIRAWRNAWEAPIAEWRFDAGDGEPVPVRLGEFWPTVATPVRLTSEATIPAEWGGQPVELELWLGGEGLLRLSTGLQAGLDPFHYRFPVAAAAGEAVAIEAEVVPKGMFGMPVPEPRLQRAHLVVPHATVVALERDLTMAVEACRVLADHEVVPHLLDAIEAAYAALEPGWPSATPAAVSRFVHGYVSPTGSAAASLPASFAPFVDGPATSATPHWQVTTAPEPPGPLPDEAIAAVERARVELADRLGALRERYPPVGRLALTGHAHIDLGWLWPVAETRRKVRRTFSTVLDLMDRYDDFTFNQSSAQVYAWIAEDDPALLERIGRRVAEGRWEAVGGSWAEPDCNMIGGESFVRHLLYGQRLVESLFGRRHAVAWLPDVFGFSGAIPQLLRGAGIDGFFTIKLTWNEANTFPHDLFEWEGIDGSRVVAHMFRNLPPAHGYNGNIVPWDAFGTWQQFRGKRHHPESLLAFGWGDGGGGPSAPMLENYARIKDYPALPRLRMARIDDLFASLPKEGLPRWVGELYLELHRGTLTTQARVKALNRAAEHRLLEAEAFATQAALAGGHVPAAELETAWKTLLLNQFHDILPGSSIAEVYEVTHRELDEVVATATAARDAALRQLARATTELVGGERGDAESAPDNLLVANASLAPQPLSAMVPRLAPGTTVVDASGVALPIQDTADGTLVHAPSREVPGIGWVVLATMRGGTHRSADQMVSAVEAKSTGEGALLENDLLRVELGADGSMHRIVDKEVGRDVLDGRGNQLWAFVDKPRAWDAWDVDEDYEREGEEIVGVEAIDVAEDGPLRGAVRVVRRWRGSRIEQTYRLLAGTKRLDVDTSVDWHERQVLLQARFPLAVRSHEATAETMFGVVRRPTHRNTSWDAARFEVCAHRFLDLSEPGYGVALLNDGKYGHGVRGGTVSLSLLRGPLYPDPFADEGEHRLRYALVPHAGDWSAAGVAAEAFAFNSPLVVVPVSGKTEPARDTGFLTVTGLPLALASLKRPEGSDGDRVAILRLYEPHGARGTATLRFAQRVAAVEGVNLLEEPEGNRASVLQREGETISVEFRPFQVVTLRVEFVPEGEF